jgi:hypothetical protein
VNTTNPPPPGWYPDPAGRAPFRYWDGMRWTEHVQQGTAPAPAPSPGVPAAPAPPTPHYAAGPHAQASPYAGQQPPPAGYGHAAQPATGPLNGQTFVAELKRFDGWAIVVVGFLLFMVCSFLPWTGGEVSGPGGSVDDTANAWDGDSPWLIRGYEVNDTNVSIVIQDGTLDSGTDMVLLLPVALAAVGVAVAVRNGKRFKNSAEIGLAAAGLLAVGMIAEAVHVSGALDDASKSLTAFGLSADLGLEFGFIVGVLAAILMAVGAGRTYMASRQPGR